MSALPPSPAAALPPFIKRPVFAYLMMLATIVVWASAFAGIRFVLREISPMALTVVRLVVASLLLGVVGWLARVPVPDREDLRPIVGAALLGFTFYHVALNVGTNYISAGQASFIIATIPIWTAVLAGRFLKEAITLRTWAGLALGIGGVGYMSLQTTNVSVSMGSLLVLLAATFAAGNMTISKHLLKKYRAIDVSIYATILGTLPLLLYLPWTLGELRQMSATAWWVTIYLAVIPISLGYWMSSIALAILPASRTAQMLLLVPPVAALIAWLTIDEPPSQRLLIGGPLILLGVLLGNARRSRKARGRGGQA